MTDKFLLEKCKNLIRRPYVGNVSKKILFLSLPRCGSSFLCDIVTKHGQLGFPEEWFDQKFIETFSKNVMPLTDAAAISSYCDFVVHKSATANGCFSLNLQLPSYVWWLSKGINWIEAIGFDQVYFLYRQDKYAQVYSWAIAKKSNIWRKTTEQGKRELPEGVNFNVMSELLSHLLQFEWRYEQQIKAKVNREFKYEDFCQDIPSTIQIICKDVGVGFEPSRVQDSQYKIQRTDYDQTPLKQFRSFMQSKFRKF